MQSGKINSKWLAAGAAIALLALLAWAMAPRPELVEVAAVQVGPFESSIEEDGKTRVLDRYVVSAPLAGRWLRPSLREGDAVAAGDLLGQILPAAAPLLDERSSAELRARVDAADAAQRAALSRLAVAKVGLEQARRTLLRSEQLSRQGFVGEAKLEGDQLAMRAATEEQAAAAAEAQLAQFGLVQARAALGLFSGGGGRAFDLRSPVAGLVLRLHQASEAVLALGTPLLEIGDTAKLEVVAELLSADALLARPGSKALIERWGGPQALTGKVSRVEPGAFTKVSALGVEEQRVRVIVELTSPLAGRERLGDGYRVALKIITRSLPEALQVPVSAVFPLPGGGPEQRAVFAVEGGRARLTEVELEARNGRVAWLRKGPAVGSVVINYPPPAVKDGARVQKRSP
ncbi:efflux RND transporter periplasmic adaptor subunit [Roseateles oligotrophus]|uniref:HlyD family efflux transporter periplasmic adaptor subunit n=1 Tax=Roseateles oligotrophus TaxID=1769250 RepID=A0ABT2YMR1_9BURK|nr:HlyD family efflux transporter periplasmic adaptor subunit [Roseateles oligotrophus]MCV2371346.1 HlyD family efflux transporter periplasmic adaptor subunit [Roseateles oligotrophus]